MSLERVPAPEMIERRPRLVDEDGVDLVDDGVVVHALHAVRGPRDHVVAQIVEAELGVGAVGDVGLVGRALVGERHAVLEQAHAHAEKAVGLGHLLAVALGEVVVHGDHVDAVARQGVEIAGKVRDEGLALAGLHLCDHALVQRGGAYDLDVEVAHAQDAARGLAHDGKGFRHQGVEALPLLDAFLKGRRAGRQLLVGHGRIGRLDLVDTGCDLLKTLEVLVGTHVKQLLQKVRHRHPHGL